MQKLNYQEKRSDHILILALIRDDAIANSQSFEKGSRQCYLSFSRSRSTVSDQSSNKKPTVPTKCDVIMSTYPT